MTLLFFISALISEIIGTIAGFGSSTVFLPLALLFFDFKTALVLVAVFHIFGNIGRISFFRNGLDKHTFLIFGVPSVVLTFLGALLVNYTPQDLLKGILGVFLAIYAVIFLWRENVRVKSSVFNSIVGGGLSGFLAGLIGTGGAIRGAFLTAFGLPKERYIATAAAIALAVDFTRIPVYFAQGFLNGEFYAYIPFLLVIALAGSFTGKQIIKKVAQKKFKKIVLIAILIVGAKFVYDFLFR